MQIDNTLLTWMVCLGIFGLVALLWGLNYFLEKANFFYWIGEILDKKRVKALQDFAANRGAMYSYKPKENYFQTLNTFTLIAFTSRIRITHELRGHTDNYAYTFFDYKYSLWSGEDNLNLSSESTFLLFKSPYFNAIPNFLFGKRFLPLLSKNSSLKPLNKENAFHQELFTPKTFESLSELHLELKELINIEKCGSQIIIDYNQIVPVEELPVFLDKGLKTIDILLGQQAQPQQEKNSPKKE